MEYLEDGQTPEEEEKKGILDSLFGEKAEPKTVQSMKVRILLDNPYTKSIDVEAAAPNSEIRTGTISYKNNRRALEKVMQLLSEIQKTSQEPAEGQPRMTSDFSENDPDLQKSRSNPRNEVSDQAE